MWDFFYYRRSERTVLLILLILLIGGVVGYRFLPSETDLFGRELRRDTTFMQACDSFFLTLRDEKPRYQNGYLPAPLPDPFPFDPNTADSALFTQLGLPGWVARNIVRYREKGGVFYRREQFARIYGIDSLRYGRLASFIQIDTLRLKKQRIVYERDTVNRMYPRKFTEITPVELNSADTALLKRIPGIGSGFAAMMVGLRYRLGGFHSVDQLRELELVSDSLLSQWKPWFVVDRSLIRPLEVNKVSVTRLRNHPYINFYQAKAITEIRRQYGRINDWEMLAMLEEFTETDIERLKPYLTFDTP